jgi:hypothetical protein
MSAETVSKSVSALRWVAAMMQSNADLRRPPKIVWSRAAHASEQASALLELLGTGTQPQLFALATIWRRLP